MKPIIQGVTESIICSDLKLLKVSIDKLKLNGFVISLDGSGASPYIDQIDGYYFIKPLPLANVRLLN